MAAEAVEGVRRHEADVTHVTKHTEEIMKLRSVKRWEGVLRRAVRQTQQIKSELKMSYCSLVSLQHIGES